MPLAKPLTQLPFRPTIELFSKPFILPPQSIIKLSFPPLILLWQFTITLSVSTFCLLSDPHFSKLPVQEE